MSGGSDFSLTKEIEDYNKSKKDLSLEEKLSRAVSFFGAGAGAGGMDFSEDKGEVKFFQYVVIDLENGHKKDRFRTRFGQARLADSNKISYGKVTLLELAVFTYHSAYLAEFLIRQGAKVSKEMLGAARSMEGTLHPGLVVVLQNGYDKEYPQEARARMAALGSALESGGASAAEGGVVPAAPGQQPWEVGMWWIGRTDKEWRKIETQADVAGGQAYSENPKWGSGQGRGT